MLYTWLYPNSTHIPLKISSIIGALRLKISLFKTILTIDSSSCTYKLQISTCVINVNNLPCLPHDVTTKLLRCLSKSRQLHVPKHFLSIISNLKTMLFWPCLCISSSHVAVNIDWRHLQVLLISTFY